MMVSWFERPNQAGYDLSVVPQNRWEDEDGHELRSSGLLRKEASLAGVSQSGLKTGGGAARMVCMASSWRSRGVEAKNGLVDEMGCIGLFYSNFIVFIVLGPKGIFVLTLISISLLGFVVTAPILCCCWSRFFSARLCAGSRSLVSFSHCGSCPSVQLLPISIADQALVAQLNPASVPIDSSSCSAYFSVIYVFPLVFFICRH
jgi:hypothetical protein